LVSAAVGAFGLAQPVAASAATSVPSPQPGKPVGTLTVTPATGTDLIAFSVTTSRACPAGGNVLATIFGQGLPPEGLNIVGNAPASIFPHTVAGGLVMPSQDSLRGLMSSLPDPQPLSGEYKLRVECRDGPKRADLGDFFGSLIFDSHHRYVAHEPNVPASSLKAVDPAVAPLPTAVGSEAPGITQPSPPAKAKSTQPALPAQQAKSGGFTGWGPWLIALGGLLAGLGVAALSRSRRIGSAEPAGR
jgi:hypothetical protein